MREVLLASQYLHHKERTSDNISLLMLNSHILTIGSLSRKLNNVFFIIPGTSPRVNRITYTKTDFLIGLNYCPAHVFEKVFSPIPI